MEDLIFTETESAKEYKIDLKSRLEHAQKRLKKRYKSYERHAREEQLKIRNVINNVSNYNKKILSKRHDDINYEIYIYNNLISQQNIIYNPNFTDLKYEDCYEFSQEIKILYKNLNITTDDYNENLYIYYFLYKSLPKA
jgi:ribosome-binding ATPase YchF (GTP1/OBG family)